MIEGEREGGGEGGERGWRRGRRRGWEGMNMTIIFIVLSKSQLWCVYQY